MAKKEYNRLVKKIDGLKKRKHGFGNMETINEKVMQMWTELKEWVEKFGAYNEQLYVQLKQKWNELMSKLYGEHEPVVGTPFNSNVDYQGTLIPIQEAYKSPSGTIKKYPYTKLGELRQFGSQLQPTYEIMGPFYNRYYS